MTPVKIIYTIATFLLLSSISIATCTAQTAADIDLATGMMNRAAPKPNWEFAKNNTNELQMLFSGLFLGYKSLLSSQDGASCTFTPSCSEYGMIAVKKKGVLIGTISTFDRLTRCNGLSPEKYGRDTKTGLLIDPVD